MTFNNLVKNYQYYLVAGEFHEKGLPRINGGAVILSGAVMPIDPPGPDGELKRFWLANPRVVMAGCVFCNPPSMADLVYIDVGKQTLKVDREKLYSTVMEMSVLGRFFIEKVRSPDGVEYLFKIQLKEVVD